MMIAGYVQGLSHEPRSIKKKYHGIEMLVASPQKFTYIGYVRRDTAELHLEVGGGAIVIDPGELGGHVPHLFSDGLTAHVKSRSNVRIDISSTYACERHNTHTKY